jgi:capsular polysaccharide biosynthesis protein
MELRAYVEGIVRKWWLIGLVMILCVWLGKFIANDQSYQYTASTTILLNEQLLASSAFPSNTVQLTVPTTYQGIVEQLAVLYHITRTYPRLTISQLQKNIVVTTDGSNQLMLIDVTDISPVASADIANFLALHFVHAQSASLTNQMLYYQHWLQQNIIQLNNDIYSLNSQLSAVTPLRTIHGPAPVLTPQQKVTIDGDQSKVNLDTRTLYAYQQALIEVQQALPLVPKAFVVLKPADIPADPSSAPLSPTTVQFIVVAVGVLLTLCLIVALDFFTPVIRHRGELQRIIGISALGELPQLRRFEQKRLLESRRIPLMRRVKPLRLLCAAISGLVAKSGGHTVLVTSPRKKRRFATLLATSLANKGQRTLLIDAHLVGPNLHHQLTITGPSGMRTNTGKALPSVCLTKCPNLFLLSAATTFTQSEQTTSMALVDLLPELHPMFDIIIIDAPPIDHAITHLLTTQAAHILLLVKKRRDNLKALKVTRAVCEEVLKVNPLYVFLT